MLSCVSIAVCLGFSASLTRRQSFASLGLTSYRFKIIGQFYKCGWGGFFDGDTRLYDAYRVDSNEWIPTTELDAAVLLIHFFVGAAMVFWGCQQKRWN